MRVRSRHVLFLAVALVYFAAGKLGLSLATVNASASAVWPPTGIALGATILLGPSILPAVFLGAFFVNVTTSGSVVASLLIALGNTAEAFFAAYLVHRFAGGRAAFDRARGLFTYAVFAGFVATAISASIGVTSLMVTGLASWSEFRAIWLTWWLGDAAGALIVGPLIVLWVSSRPVWDRRRVLESVLSLALLVVIINVVFGKWTSFGPGNYPVAHLSIPVLLYVAFRLGPHETAGANAILSGAATVGTLHGYGPFAGRNERESLLLLQAFLSVVTLTALGLSVVLSERNRAIAELDRRKDEFLATAAHELRNLLAPIRSGAQLLQRGGVAEADRAWAVELIDRQVGHMVLVIDDLFDISRIRRNQLEIRKVAVDMAHVVDRAIDTSRPLIEKRGHDLSVVMPQEPTFVEADPARLSQVLANLLNNAAKYTHRGGKILLSVVRNAQDVTVSIRDNGVGLPTRSTQGPFDVFVRAPGTSSKDGLGIGLALARRIVELHGGTVTAESDGPGMGSVFTIRLPLDLSTPAPMSVHEAE
jgi:signal transduction histidine kinase